MSLARFLPLTLRNLLAGQKDLRDPVFLDGATLFADISGFTPLSEALARMGREGSEFLTRTLNVYFEALIGQIQLQGGDIMRFAGDAVTAFFPDPAGEERAVSAGALIQRFMAQHPEAASPVGAFPIRIKIGIARGIHVFMLVGDGGARDYVFAGNPVDGAAEAEHHARPGDIILHPSCGGSGGKFSKIGGDDVPISAGSVQAAKGRGSAHEITSSDEACKPFLHPILVDKLGAGAVRLLNEHRRAAVLFVSFQGSGSGYQEATTRENLDDFYKQVRGLAETYGGFVNKIDMGDKGSKFLVTFGVPVSHEDDADRALSFAMELQKAAREKGVGLSVGINWGTIFSGIIGDERRCEYTVMGDEVNLSARLMQMATDGHILASRPLREAARSFSFKELPPARVKGKARPIELFEPVRKEDESISAGGFFVGREKELKEAASFILDGRREPRLLAVTGEAGIGKSAFINSLAHHHLPGVHVLFGRCQEFATQFPYQPWKRILRRALHRLGGVESEDPARTWTGHLSKSAPELVPFASLLLNLAEVPHALKEVKADEQTKKAVLHRQIALLLKALAGREPAAVALSNMQWMDPESGNLILDLLRTLEGPAPAFILSGRKGMPETESIVPVKKILLPPLEPKEIKTFMERSLHCSRLPEKLVKDGIAGSKGNPLLLTETLKSYQESGYVTSDEHNPEILFLDETRKPALPTTLEGIVMARFDRLPADAQALLKILSVFGETLPEELALRAVASVKGSPDILNALVSKGEFLARNAPRNLVFFPQSHFRSTIYDSLDFTSRRELHALAAKEYERFFPEETADKIQQVAFHYLTAGSVVAGKDYLFQAGRLAAETRALPAALQYFKALIEAKEQLDPAFFAESAFYLGEILVKMGRFQDVQQLFRPDWIHAAPEGDARSRLYQIAADGYRLTGNFRQAEDCLTQAKVQAHSPLQQFRVLTIQGTMYAQMSNFREALNLFEALETQYKSKVPESTFLQADSIIGPLLFVLGKSEEAFRHLERARRIALSAHDMFSLIRIMHNIATFNLQLSNHIKAYKYYLDSMKIQEAFGISQYTIITINEIGYEAMLLGDWKKAHFQFNYGDALAKKYGDPYRLRILCNAAELDQYSGGFDLSRRKLSVARRISQDNHFEPHRITYYWTEFVASINHGKALARFLGRLRAQIEKERAGYLQLLHDAYLAWAHYLLGKMEEARALAEDTRVKAREARLFKENYLCLKILAASAVSKSDKQRLLQELLAGAEQAQERRMILEAVVMNLEEEPREFLFAKGRRILRRTPFALQAWRFHTLQALWHSKQGLKRKAKIQTAKACSYYDRIFLNLPERIKGPFANDPLARQLEQLRKDLKVSSPAPLPRLYAIFEDAKEPSAPA